MPKPITTLWLSAAELSVYGVTEQAIHTVNRDKFNSRGIKAGKLDAFKWLAALKKHGNPAKPGKLIAALELAIRDKGGAPPAEPVRDPEPQAEDGGGFNTARTRREWAKAKMAEVELQKAQGKLLDAGEFLRKFGNMITSAKMRLLAVANEVAQEVAVESDPFACQAIVSARIEDALTELSAWKPPAARRKD